MIDSRDHIFLLRGKTLRPGPVGIAQRTSRARDAWRLRQKELGEIAKVGRNSAPSAAAEAYRETGLAKRIAR
jgi:hypothetical protein